MKLTWAKQAHFEEEKVEIWFEEVSYCFIVLAYLTLGGLIPYLLSECANDVNLVSLAFYSCYLSSSAGSP
jgi:hypothetical protein